jgi:hypothetical protein
LVRQGRFEEASGWWDRWLKLSAEHGGSPEDIRAVERAAEAAKLLERVVRRERG